MKETLKILDTTLRDGEQSPGCSMSLRDKLLVARHLERLRVDVIEAGFAASSHGSAEAIDAIARQAKDCTVASLSRVIPSDIDAAAAALANALNPRIHLFIATSPLHMRKKLRMTPDEVLSASARGIKRALRHCAEVEFSLEDATRSDPDFVCRVVERAIKAGASIINIPDTVGYALPDSFAGFVRDIMERVPNSGAATFSVHCHDDLGMAVANSLAGILAGARQVECALNGLGERAGNAALEELVMAIRTRADAFHGIDCRVDSTRIYGACRVAAAVTGCPIPRNKAIVGVNAFSHEAGVHQQGVLADPRTYEIMSPVTVGRPRRDVPIGRHSGRHAFETRLVELGFSFPDDVCDELFGRFKALADQKKQVTNADIEAIARSCESSVPERVSLTGLAVNRETSGPTGATVRIFVDGAVREASAKGDGPIDAAVHAINAILGIDSVLEDFKLTAVTGGVDAQSEATVRVRFGERVYNGHGLSTDVVEAAIRSYLAAVNKILAEHLATTTRPGPGAEEK